MDDIAVGGSVGHIDGHRPAFSGAERTGYLAVIRDGLDVATRSGLEHIGCNVDGVIRGSDLLSTPAQRRGSDSHTGQLEQLAGEPSPILTN